MSVKIRLTREGRHEKPFYRIVAADSRYTRDGRYIEQVGYYDPAKGIENAVVYEEIALKWLNTGAQYSGTVKAILTSKKLVEKAKENKTTVKKAKVVSTKSSKATKKEAKGE